MGLCSSKSPVSLIPNARIPNADAKSQAAGSSREGTPSWEDRCPMMHVTKVKVEAGARGDGCLPNAPGKGYLELGGKGKGEPQASLEAVDEEEDTEVDEQEELLHFADSEGSLKSEFLE